MTEEEFEKTVKPHIEGLFSGKYDLIVTPSDDHPPINYATILRALVSTVNSLLETPTKKRKLE